MPKGLLNTKGYALLESVFTVAAIGFISVAVAASIVYGRQANNYALNAIRANNLAQEALEAVRNIRSADFFALKVGYHKLMLNNGQWQLLPSNDPEVVDGIFKRQIIITEPEPNTRRVEAVVNWPSHYEIRLTAQFRNWTPTVEDWSRPFYDGDFDLTPANSGSNNHKVRAVKVQGGRLFVGNDNSAGKEFLIFDITRSPDLTIKGSLDLNGDPQKIAIYSHYAFLASDYNFGELQVIDWSDDSQPALAAEVDLPGNDDGRSIDITEDGKYAVLGRENGEMYIFNISSLANPLQVSALSLTGSPDINDINIEGNYAFIAAGDGSVRSIDISNPTNPLAADTLSLSGCDNALSIDTTSDRFYVGCGSERSSDKIYIGNILNPNSMLLIATAGNNDYPGGKVVHISFDPNKQLIFLLSDNSSADFQVWDLSNELRPSLLSFVDLNGDPSQADYSQLMQKMFVGLTSNPEIQIVSPTLVYE